MSNIRWVSDLRSQEARDAFHKVLGSNASNKVLIRLKEILKKDLDVIQKLEVSPTEMDNPNWANKQAYFNGQKKAINDVLKLLEFTQ